MEQSEESTNRMDKKKEESQPVQVPTSSRFGDTLPALNSTNRNIFSQLYKDPYVTTMNSFSHVAQLVKNPYELINNVDELVRQASGGSSSSSSNRRKHQKTSESSATTLDQNTQAEPSVQELNTFVAGSQDQSISSTSQAPASNVAEPESKHDNQLPIPALPPIESSSKRGRLEPLTIEEYEQLRLSATDLELVERVFYGGIACNQLRAALWPYLFGLIVHRGRFEKISNSEGQEAFLFIEHEGNTARWRELHQIYNQYQAQWKSILPDQEKRFSTFRERKSLIERDVIRCDRLHPFYAEEPQNLDSLTSLLMTYMMYDFDIGYVQGMSDLAGPILYMYRGDIIKSFWVFVEVMKLFRRNFELTQKTIHFQLSCLYELIKTTDPIFAQYLREHESSNCFFAFRAIVCQFKRELMKEDEDDYSKVLFLWDTIWCAKRRCVLQEELKALEQDDMQVETSQAGGISEKSSKPVTQQPSSVNDSPFYNPFDPNQSDTPRHTLTETEIFVLALCLSMIRRERDLILANRLDSTDIHLHFIDPKLSSDLNGFIEHGINIYSYMKNDLDITKLTSPNEHQAPNKDNNPESPPEDYDVLSDSYLLIGASSGS